MARSDGEFEPNTSRFTKKFSFLEEEGRVGRFFLISFLLILAFFIGTGVGNRVDESIVDSAIDQIQSNSPDGIERSVLERAAIEGALRASGDEWANYFPASTLSELTRVTSNVMTGAGISITKTRSGALRVADVQSNSPAERVGISVGDQLLTFNGKNIQGLPATIVGAMIKAESGKKITLAVSRGTEVIKFLLKTEPVEFRTVDGYQISEGVAYIAISSFSSGTADELARNLDDLDSKNGVILDLRDNPGGLLEEAVHVAELFIGRGVIVSYKVNGEESVLSARNSSPNNAPVVILINRGTSSSAEIVAAAFQDRNRGVVIGERSYGKGSVQEFVTLSDGSKLELTVGLYLTPAGRTIEQVGVEPDLDVSDSEVATKALQILGGLAQLGASQESERK